MQPLNMHPPRDCHEAHTTWPEGVILTVAQPANSELSPLSEPSPMLVARCASWFIRTIIASP